MVPHSDLPTDEGYKIAAARLALDPAKIKLKTKRESVCVCEYEHMLRTTPFVGGRTEGELFQKQRENVGEVEVGRRHAHLNR